MATAPKVTFDYVNRRTSWSESHTHTATDKADDVLADARKLGNARVALFGEVTTLAHIAISYPDQLGDALDTEPDVQSTVIPEALKSNDELAVCLKVRMKSQTGGSFRKLMYLADLPDNLILQAGKDTFTNSRQWDDWFQHYMSILCGGGKDRNPSVWGFMAKDKTGKNLGRNPIIGFDYVAGVVTITTKNNHGFSPRDLIQIRGLRTDLLGVIAGKFYVTAIPVDNGGLPINNKFQFPAVLTTGVMAGKLDNATVERPAYQYRAYSGFDKIQWGTRKRGVGRYAPRGRKRTRRRGS